MCVFLSFRNTVLLMCTYTMAFLSDYDNFLVSKNSYFLDSDTLGGLGRKIACEMYLLPVFNTFRSLGSEIVTRSQVDRRFDVFVFIVTWDWVG